uniref:Uncharacterized protein n=1 Tax=Candidatus Caldatribacterium saccharofermentans TaxID=1454753 RepID=A0A7V4TFN7_9BACT
MLWESLSPLSHFPSLLEEHVLESRSQSKNRGSACRECSTPFLHGGFGDPLAGEFWVRPKELLYGEPNENVVGGIRGERHAAQYTATMTTLASHRPCA